MNNNRAILFGLGAVALWSTVATAFKLALAEVDTIQLVFYSTLTAAISLTAFTLATRGVRVLIKEFKAHWPMTLVAGLLNPVVYYLVLFTAYDRLPAQVAMSINYTWAIVLVAMAVVFLKQPIKLFDGIAAIICYGGVVVIATQGDLTSFANVDLPGIGLALLSTLIWAGYWTINIWDRREPVVGLSLNFLIALPIATLICFYWSGFTVSQTGLVSSIYVGFVEMAGAFVLWSIALKLTDNAARVSNLIFLSPFVSLVIINQVLGEPIYATTLFGLALIIGGLLLQQYVHRNDVAEAGA